MGSVESVDTVVLAALAVLAIVGSVVIAGLVDPQGK